MADIIQKAIPGTARCLTSKERLLLCKLTGFKIEKNLAVENDMAIKKQSASEESPVHQEQS